MRAFRQLPRSWKLLKKNEVEVRAFIVREYWAERDAASSARRQIETSPMSATTDIV
jgi:hypothetical protein